MSENAASLKLLWHGSWVDAPGYQVPDAAVAVGVEATVPVISIEHASGRVLRQPYRKFVTFLRTDGPRSTLRRALTKRGQASFLGDLRVAVVHGRALDSGRPVVALGCRVPPCAEQLPVHRDLVREAPEGFDERQLVRVAAALARERDLLVRHSAQGYLYSAMNPPPGLVQAFESALERCDAESASPAATLVPIRPPGGSAAPAPTAIRTAPRGRPDGLRVALLGAGDYARTEVIPALRGAGLALHSVADREPQIAAMVGRKHGFEIASSDAEEAIAELPEPGLVVIATAHDSHARLASAAVRSGHRAFVEKPPTVTPADVELLAGAMTDRPGRIEIGFNRRYHPLIRTTRRALEREHGPASITCVIKEVDLEPDHWYFWPNQGTRITGNLCHWIDLAVFLLGPTLPVSVTLSAEVPGGGQAIDEERALLVTFDDGSLLTVIATNRGDDIRGVQEQIEVRKGRTTIRIDDMWKVRLRRGGTDRYRRTAFRHKAHRQMYRESLRRLRSGEPAGYPPADMVVVSAIQIAASELARSGEPRCDAPPWLRPTLQRLG